MLTSVGAPYEGEKNTELDSACSSGTGGNIYLYQDLPIKAGSQFWYKKRATVTQTVDARLGSTMVFSKANEALQWTRVSITFITDASSTRLAFTDRGPSDGQGSILDQVEMREVNGLP
ncbi:hypothetical protein [Oligoflexus tunisiensis]|uniref:hypothetical protein n=1 Tax=Oligoflexus tunisiensis TaxID=708132 RepID=UPI00114CB876|nr:hypothetical protein [Oligoflexus tunisiensis]